MNDPLQNVMRFVMAAFVPIMLLFPLVFTLRVPMRVVDDEAKRKADTLLRALMVMTFLSISVWTALILLARVSHADWLGHVTRVSWLLFFPLWFALAMPAAVARNPAWSSGNCGVASTSSTVRTASLVPRPRENPIKTGQWVLVVLLAVGLCVAVAIRGAFSFGPPGPSTDAARFRWILVTGVYAVCTLTMLLVLPFCIARMQVEPEPLDPAGSSELVELYRQERVRRIRGMYWLLGVVQPLLLGSIMAAVVWLPGASGRTLGLIGGFGGAAVGIAGGVFGCLSSLRRMRIAEVKARLEHGVAASGNANPTNR